ncbi:MAG: SH3 domain-containing protein [Paludibacteraceae bacterium]|nr:SH3 domain-containing protein [Paludibacteraceae bacterium]
MKRVYFLVFLFISVFCCAETEYVVTASALNVRSGCSTESTKLGTLPNGQRVVVYDIKGDWATIAYKGGYAYISSKWIALAPSQKSSSTNDTPITNTINSPSNNELPLSAYASDTSITSSPNDNVSGGFMAVGLGYLYSFGKVNGELTDDGGHGFQLGVITNWMLSDHFGLFFDLGFQESIAKSKIMGVDFRSSIFSVYMNAHVSMSIPISSNLVWLVHAGPGFTARGVYDLKYRENGKWKTSSAVQDMEKRYAESNKIGDFVLGVGTGLKFDKMSLLFGFNWGLVNQVKDGNGKNFNRNLNVTLTYNFL